MSNDYPCCNDCGSLDARYDRKFGCFLCDECFIAACEEERELLEDEKQND